MRQLGVLKSGETVYDRPRSHLAVHKDGELERVLTQALTQTDSHSREFVEETVDFCRVVGETNCVETTADDDVVYAYRKHRKGPSRFVRARALQPTTFLTFVLKKIQDGYILITAYFGPHAPPEPWDPHAILDSEKFWRTHALVWQPETLQEKTSTATEKDYFGSE